MINLRAVCLPVFSLGLCLVPQAWGFPGPTPTLDERWVEARLVIYADVVSAKRVDYGQDVVLSTIEVLKSEPDERPKNISVVTRYGGCPYPFNFREGTKVIAFLVFDPDDKRFTPWGAYAGCIEVDEVGFRQYAGALKKLPDILNQEDASIRERLLLDWHVASALQTATRGDGALGISYHQQSAKGIRNLLTPAHQEQLVKALISESPPGAEASSVVNVLTAYASRALDLYLLESLRRSHEVGWKDLTRSAIEVLPQRLGIKLEQKTQQRLDEWGDLISLVYYQIDQDAEPERFAREKERLDILWGALSAEIHHHCKSAIDSRR